MRYAGPHMFLALVVALVGAITLFLASTTWLEVIGAIILLIGSALIVANVATPEFLERDLDEE